MLTMGQLADTFYSETLKALSISEIQTSSVANGLSFVVGVNSAIDTIDIAAPLNILLIAPDDDKLIHLGVAISIVSAGSFDTFEDDGNLAHFNVSGGVALTSLNRNRNSLIASDVLAYSAPTVTAATDDARILSERIGGVLGGDVREGSYLILKKNTKYLFRIRTDADNNEGSITLSWFRFP